MLKQDYTADDVRRLKRAKPSLNKTEAEKYAMYKSTDPFPWIGEALLNSADLLKYLLAVGIVEPFDERKLKGVTYQCTFSGEAHYFDSDTKKMEEINLSDDGELVLRQNSITYLKIAEKFHVPEYMVLRFNLSVSNAYKGLLLGTGPIIDPGFNGNLFIPLHNLTGNEYVIKKGASLIRVEFTKLSRHPVWNNREAEVFPSVDPITKETPPYTSFATSIEDALLDPDKKRFYTKGDVISVRSSIPDVIKKSADKAEEAQKSATTAANEAEKARKTARNWSIAGWIATAIAVATVVITSVGIALTSYSLAHDAHTRFDSIARELETCKQQISALTQQLETAREQLEQYVTALPQNDEPGIEQEAPDGIAPVTPPSSDEVDEGFDGS